MKRESIPEIEKLEPPPRLAVVVSPYYKEIAKGMLDGAKDYLQKLGVSIDEKDIFTVAGSFEIPLIAKKLAQTGAFEGVICLGCIIKGETANFHYVSLGTANGIMQANLETEIPIAFGIITAYTEGQAMERSCGKTNNGVGAAEAVVQSIRELRRIAKILPKYPGSN